MLCCPEDAMRELSDAVAFGHRADAGRYGGDFPMPRTTPGSCDPCAQPGFPATTSKRPWTYVESQALERLVLSFGEGNWKLISARLNAHFGWNEATGRSAKQCRERWLHTMKPGVKKGGWNEQEEQIIIKGHSMFGNKWSEIARLLPGRTHHAVKNHWNSTLQRKGSCSSSLEEYMVSIGLKGDRSGARVQQSLRSDTPCLSADPLAQLPAATSRSLSKLSACISHPQVLGMPGTIPTQNVGFAVPAGYPTTFAYPLPAQSHPAGLLGSSEIPMCWPHGVPIHPSSLVYATGLPAAHTLQYAACMQPLFSGHWDAQIAAPSSSKRSVSKHVHADAPTKRPELESAQSEARTEDVPSENPPASASTGHGAQEAEQPAAEKYPATGRTAGGTDTEEEKPAKKQRLDSQMEELHSDSDEQEPFDGRALPAQAHAPVEPRRKVSLNAEASNAPATVEKPQKAANERLAALPTDRLLNLAYVIAWANKSD